MEEFGGGGSYGSAAQAIYTEPITTICYRTPSDTAGGSEKRSRVFARMAQAASRAGLLQCLNYKMRQTFSDRFHQMEAAREVLYGTDVLAECRSQTHTSAIRRSMNCAASCFSSVASTFRHLPRSKD